MSTSMATGETTRRRQPNRVARVTLTRGGPPLQQPPATGTTTPLPAAAMATQEIGALVAAATTAVTTATTAAATPAIAARTSPPATPNVAASHETASPTATAATTKTEAAMTPTTSGHPNAPAPDTSITKAPRNPTPNPAAVTIAQTAATAGPATTAAATNAPTPAATTMARGTAAPANTRSVPAMPEAGKQPNEHSKKSWTSLFASQASTSSKTKLHYEPPTMKGGRLMISATPEELAEGQSHWQNALVGYFIGSRPPYQIVKTRAETMWKPIGGMEVLTLPAGFYIFRFALAKDRNRVLEGGPWFIQNRLLLLKPWDQSTRLQKINLSAIPVWVKIHDLPMALWTPTLISRIASGVGVPLHMDQATATRTRISYARVCVEISAEEQLPDQIELSVNEDQDCILRLEYDRRSPRCSQCCVFGHSDTHCPTQTVKGKAVWVPKQQ